MRQLKGTGDGNCGHGWTLGVRLVAEDFVEMSEEIIPAAWNQDRGPKKLVADPPK